MMRTTVILLPGLLCDEAVWRDQRQALSEFARCVVPSYGHLSSICDMARQVLSSSPSGRISLVGHSMGGRIALEIARLAPDRVERLALLDTGLDPRAAGELGEKEQEHRYALLQYAREHGMREMGRQWAKGMVHPSRLDTPLFQDILDMIERCTPQVFEAQITALLTRPDAKETFSSLRCPTLLVCGRQDNWSPLSRHEAMHQLLPGSRLVVVEEAGHMAPMEQPAFVSKALLDWLLPPFQSLSH